MTATERVLDRLEAVKPTGPGRWIARCAAHLDRSPSLSIRDMGDRVLLHCFADCATADVLAAIGLELRDLYDRPVEHFSAPIHTRIPAGDVLAAVSHEIDVALILLTEIIDGRGITEVAWARLAEAARRIGAARDHVNPARLAPAPALQRSTEPVT